jgi:predicted permease
MGVRAALGAERTRLVRQMLTEALLLAGGGGILGVLLAWEIVRVLVRLNPGGIPRMEETSLDPRVLLFMAGITVLTGLLFGLLPALAASRVNLTALLKQAGTRGIAGSSIGLRGGLIVTEVALSVILLAGAGLLIRSYLKVLSVGAGFQQSTVTMRLTMFQNQNYQTPRRQSALFRRLLGQIGGLPGVEVAGAVSAVPLSHHESVTFLEVRGYPNRKDQTVDARWATGGYFGAMGIRLLAGRFLNDDDTRQRAQVVVSRSFRDLYFAGRDPIGQQIRLGGAQATVWSRIVGVVEDVRHSSLEQAPRPMVYEAFWGGFTNEGTLTIRANGPPCGVVPLVRGALRGIDPALALEDVRTMGDLVSEAVSRRRFQTAVLAGFAAVAVLLALVGLYGLMAYAVKHRTAEVGIRMALGASRRQVLGMVLRQGLGLVGAGLALGIGGALALTHVVAAWLFGVPAADPVTFLAVPALILLTSAGACLVPAWRATRIDPVNALRWE